MKTIDNREFRMKLLRWWGKNGRNFPWRDTKNPYRILIAEILLHRTKADQVAPAYLSFINKFPSIADIVNASEAEITGAIRSLGLTWRSKLIHHMAVIILEKYGGEIPTEKKDLETLPGVSHYIASAVRTFAFGYPDVLLDTNTVRIVGRVFGQNITDGSRRSRLFRELLESLLDRQNPREFNFALLDLGAMICKSTNPLCGNCPVTSMCNYAKDVKIFDDVMV